MTIVSEALGLEVSGMLLGGAITAVLKQNGAEFPLSLAQDYTPPEMKRPQEPQPPYPYRCEEVTFPSAAAGAELHGTLTLPQGDGPFPAVAMVTGSGTQNRDEEILGHKPFKVIADFLTRRGIAVLRYDDRCYGREYDGSTTMDYALDALNAVAYLKERPETDASRIGVVGHSEGGTIAFMCAARSGDVAFVVSLAGMTVSGRDCVVWQNRRSLERMGLPQETVARFCEAVGHMIDTMAASETALGPSEAERTTAEALAECGAEDMPPQMREAMVKTAAESNEWFRFFVGYDPAEDLRHVKCDVLAMNGTLDMQVDAEMNLGVLERCDGLSGRLTTRRYEGLNHLFQHCVTGLPAEYGTIEETFAEEVLADMAEWILGRGK